MASKEANRAKYLYNKKYQDAYWERKAKKLAEQNEEANGSQKLRKRVTRTKTVEEFFVTERDKDDYRLPISRPDNYSDEKWMKYLEDAVKCYRSENKRLINLLAKYQYVIKIGLESINYQQKNDL